MDTRTTRATTEDTTGAGFMNPLNRQNLARIADFEVEETLTNVVTTLSLLLLVVRSTSRWKVEVNLRDGLYICTLGFMGLFFFFFSLSKKFYYSFNVL